MKTRTTSRAWRARASRDADATLFYRETARAFVKDAIACYRAGQHARAQRALRLYLSHLALTGVDTVILPFRLR